MVNFSLKIGFTIVQIPFLMTQVSAQIDSMEREEACSELVAYKVTRSLKLRMEATNLTGKRGAREVRRFLERLVRKREKERLQSE